MTNTTAQPHFTRLRRFRQSAYLFTHCKDAFFALLDAVLQTPTASSFAALALAPAFDRQWPSVYQAINDVRYDEQGLRELCLAQIRSTASPTSHWMSPACGACVPRHWPNALIVTARPAKWAGAA